MKKILEILKQADKKLHMVASYGMAAAKTRKKEGA